MDIQKLIKLPESKTLEFKRDSSSLESILKTIVAFSNTAGGILIIGVADDHTIYGLENPSKSEEQIVNSVAHRIKPQISPDFHIMEVKGKFILVIQVDYLLAPYYLSDKGEEKGVYIRIGNSNRLASVEAIAEMKRAKQHPFFDKAPCDSVVESDLDKELILKTFSDHKVTIDTSKLFSIGLLVQKGKRILASNGGVILFGKADIRQKYFPYAEVRCARFSGSSRAEFIDRLNIEGGILAAVTEVPKFIRRNTKTAGKFGSMRRRDIPEYPIDGIRETLTNALVHANYEISGTRIFVAIYDDKLEIQNPGIMPPGMSIEQFKAGVSRIRNPVIARIFSELELVEEWGSGYKRIREACQKDGYPEPIWEEFGTVTRVTFFPHPEVVKISVEAELGPSRDQVGTKLGPSWDQVKSEEVWDSEVMILLDRCHIPQNIIELMDVLKWTNRTKFRHRYVVPLIKKGLLKMTVPDKPQSSKQKYQLTEEGSKQRASLETKPGPSWDQVGTKLGPGWDQVKTESKWDLEAITLLGQCRTPQNITDLMNVLKWTNRTKFRHKYIVPLVDAGLLTMTVPDKPQSSKQKYQLTKKGLKELTKNSVK
jgi:predicted HTH transcriptional regulator